MKKSKKQKDTVQSKMIIQGYDLTTAKYKANLYQKRMMLAITSAAQSKISGERYLAGKKFEIKEGEFPVIKIPINLILQNDENNSNNIYAVRKAIKQFIGRTIEFKDVEGNWIVFSPIITGSIPKYESSIILQVHKLFWDAILDYRSGYRKLDVRRAIALKSVYAIRFYELFSGKTEPITYTVEQLKTMFSLTTKYKKINDFIRFVLEPAKKELDLAAPYSFTYTPVIHGLKYYAFTFTPIHYPERDDTTAEDRDLQRKLSLSWNIQDRRVRDYLMNSIGFTEIEIKNNIVVFRRAAELLPDVLSTLAVLKGKSREKNNPKGWIIKALEGKVGDLLEKLGQNKINEIEDIAKNFKTK